MGIHKYVFLQIFIQTAYNYLFIQCGLYIAFIRKLIVVWRIYSQPLVSQSTMVGNRFDFRTSENINVLEIRMRFCIGQPVYSIHARKILVIVHSLSSAAAVLDSRPAHYHPVTSYCLLFVHCRCRCARCLSVAIAAVVVVFVVSVRAAAVVVRRTFHHCFLVKEVSTVNGL